MGLFSLRILPIRLIIKCTLPLKVDKKTVSVYTIMKETIPQRYYSISNKIKHLTTNTKENNFVSEDNYNEIFRLPMIKYGYILHKSKWYQTLLSGAVLPTVTLMYYNGMIDYNVFWGIMVANGTLVGNLYTVSGLFENAIGFMYLNDDESTLKISYLDFWGRRIDEEYSVEEVMPLNESPSHFLEFLYRYVMFYSKDTHRAKLYLKFGIITDKDKFEKVFGKLDP